MSDHDNERSIRILHAGELLFKAATALEKQDWAGLRDLASEAAREARCLLLIDRQQAREKEC